MWSPANGEKPPLLYKIPDDGDSYDELLKPLRPGEEHRTSFEAVGRFMLDEGGISQFGGHPEWIQNATYPECPDCQQTMLFVGQVSLEDWEEDAEGCFYAFLCLPCKKAATLYQQT
jgi:hypothetical protein